MIPLISTFAVMECSLKPSQPYHSPSIKKILCSLHIVVKYPYHRPSLKRETRDKLNVYSRCRL